MKFNLNTVKSVFFRIRLIKNVLLGKSICPPERVIGINIEDMISLWLAMRMEVGYYIVMHDIDVSHKDISFWYRLPKGILLNFVNNDVIFLSVKDEEEAMYIYNSISEDFAKVSIFKNSTRIL